MRCYDNRARGAILIAAIVIMILLAALAIGYFYGTVERSERSEVDKAHLKALLNADSGVDVWIANAAAEDVSSPPPPESPTWWEGFFNQYGGGELSDEAVSAYEAWSDVETGEGQFKVVAVAWKDDGVDNDGDGSVDESDENNFYTLTACGKVPLDDGTDLVRTLEVVLSPLPDALFDGGLFAEESIQMQDAILTDSYNSDVGNYDPLTAGHRGDVGSNGTIQVEENAEIYGDVLTSGVNNGGGIQLEDNVIVSGDVLASVGDVQLEDGINVAGNVGTSNGNIQIEDLAASTSTVGGNVDTANGTVDIEDAVIGGDVSPGPGLLPDSTIENSVIGGSVHESGYGPSVPQLQLPAPPTGDGFTEHSGGAGPMDNMNAALLADPVLAPFLIDHGDGTISIDIPNGTAAPPFPAGNYYLRQLELDQNASLTFAGDVNIRTLEDFTIDQGADLIVTGNANIAAGDGLSGDFDFEVDQGASVTFQGTANISAEEIEFEGSVTFQGEATLDALEELEFDSSSVVNFDAGVTIDAQQELEFDGDSVVTIGGPSEWYVGEELELDDDAVVITPSERAADLLISVWGLDSEVEIESGHAGKFVGAIYAPYSSVEVEGDLEDPVGDGLRFNFQGAIIGNTIAIAEDANFHYDEALGSIGAPSANRFSILVERELPAGLE